MPAAESCLTCKFWKQKYDSDLEVDGSPGVISRTFSGFCRRSPPSNSIERGFPDAGSDDWCGEYVKKKVVGASC